MRKIAVLRLFLPFLFAFIGLFLGCLAGLFLLDAGLLGLWDCCVMTVGGRGMWVGSMLGSLFGCALAVPRGSASTGRRILSFILSPVVAILGQYACFPLLDTIPLQYQDSLLFAMFLLIVPALSLFGFSIPVLL